jgi:hypothetical protein
MTAPVTSLKAEVIRPVPYDQYRADMRAAALDAATLILKLARSEGEALAAAQFITESLCQRLDARRIVDCTEYTVS